MRVVKSTFGDTAKGVKQKDIADNCFKDVSCLQTPIIEKVPWRSPGHSWIPYRSSGTAWSALEVFRHCLKCPGGLQALLEVPWRSSDTAWSALEVFRHCLKCPGGLQALDAVYVSVVWWICGAYSTLSTTITTTTIATTTTTTTTATTTTMTTTTITQLTGRYPERGFRLGTVEAVSVSQPPTRIQCFLNWILSRGRFRTRANQTGLEVVPPDQTTTSSLASSSSFQLCK